MSAKQRAEATGTTSTTVSDEVTITWRAATFRLPRAEDFPLEALEAEEDGKYLTALKLILGEAQYTAWRRIARTAADVEEFSAQVMTQVGPGNR